MAVRACFFAALLVLACDDIGDRPASWSQIHAAIVAPSCITANCHSGLSATAGLAFDDREAAYADLVGWACHAPATAPPRYVVPGQPETSTLMFLLRAEQRRLRMPPDTPLPPADIQLIERWIREGAPCN